MAALATQPGTTNLLKNHPLFVSKPPRHSSSSSSFSLPKPRSLVVRNSEAAEPAAAAVKVAKEFKVKSVKARQIIDSRGNPTVEVDLVTGGDLFDPPSPAEPPLGFTRRWSLEMGIRAFM